MTKVDKVGNPRQRRGFFGLLLDLEFASGHVPEKLPPVNVGSPEKTLNYAVELVLREQFLKRVSLDVQPFRGLSHRDQLFSLHLLGSVPSALPESSVPSSNLARSVG